MAGESATQETDGEGKIESRKSLKGSPSPWRLIPEKRAVSVNTAPSPYKPQRENVEAGTAHLPLPAPPGLAYASRSTPPTE